MRTPLRVLELRSVRGTGGGPEKTILLGAACVDRARYAVTVCYIRDERDAVFRIDETARSLGVDYVEIKERHSLDHRVWRSLRELVRGRQIDIVHAHEYKTDLLALLIARHDRVVPVATVHGWTGHTLRERVYYAADKRLLARFPRLVAVSTEIRDELVRYGASTKRISVVLNGIDPAVFRRDRASEATARAGLGLAPTDIVIGAIGRIEPQKRFDVLVAAFADVLRRRPNLKLLIAGDGSARRDIESIVARLGICHAVRLLGHRSDVIQLHHAFDLFVQSSAYEGTPNALLEAMALETPFVATDAGGTRDLFEAGVHGILVPTDEPRAIVRAIDRCLDDRPGARERATAARERIEKDLSFDRRMRTLESIYDQLAELPGRHRQRRSGAVAS